MSRLQTVRVVYQCDIGSEYLDTSVARAQSIAWSAVVPSKRVSREAVTDETKQVLNYVRSGKLELVHLVKETGSVIPSLFRFEVDKLKATVVQKLLRSWTWTPLCSHRS